MFILILFLYTEIIAQENNVFDIDQTIKSLNESFEKIASEKDAEVKREILNNIIKNLDSKEIRANEIGSTKLIPLIFEYLEKNDENLTRYSLFFLHILLQSNMYDGRNFPDEIPVYELTQDNIDVLHTKLAPLLIKEIDTSFLILEHIQPSPPNIFLEDILDFIKQKRINSKSKGTALRVLGRFRPVTQQNKQVLLKLIEEESNYSGHAISGLIKAMPADVNIVSNIIYFTKSSNEKVKKESLLNLLHITNIIKLNEDAEEKIPNHKWQFPVQIRALFASNEALEVLKKDVFIRNELHNSQVDFIDLSLDKNETIENRKLALTLSYNINEYNDDFLRALNSLIDENQPEELRVHAFSLLTRIQTRPSEKFIKNIEEISIDENEPPEIKDIAQQSFNYLNQLPKTKSETNKYLYIAGVLLVLVILGFLVRRLKIFKNKNE